ncbi:MAG: hypothetical protein AAFO15_00790 [Pseudomonadota bacterium]
MKYAPELSQVVKIRKQYYVGYDLYKVLKKLRDELNKGEESFDQIRLLLMRINPEVFKVCIASNLDLAQLQKKIKAKEIYSKIIKVYKKCDIDAEFSEDEFNGESELEGIISLKK